MTSLQPMFKVSSLCSELKQLADPAKAKVLQRFFKTGKGQYGEGDQFLGITVPQQRIVAKKYQTLALDDLEVLLSSPIHEERLIALLILVLQNKKADAKTRATIFNFYITHTRGINNWDLVDLSAPHIVGQYLFDKEKTLLYDFVVDSILWKRRIAMVATQYFIRQNSFQDTVALAEMLLKDKEDLIHKASGWMLREMGKRDIAPLEHFLHKHALYMPRTMLRYAIEKFPEPQRLHWMGLQKRKGNDLLINYG